MAKKNEEKKRFKFKQMKVYGSLESFHNNSKNYRIVFDESEVSYVNVEVQLYNILFDEEEWSAKIRVRASEYYSGKEYCNVEKELKAGIDQNIVYIREGWGTPQPGWWKKGTYKWEVFLDDELIGTNYFYITNNGIVTPEHNPYFSINNIRLYESPRGNTPKEERKYLSQFSKDTARYISIEMELTNLVSQEDYFPLELIFNFYNDVRQMKGSSYWFEHISDHRKQIILDVGYGSDAPGFWFADKYICEVLFMDNIVAIVPFEVADQDVALSGNQIWMDAVSNDAVINDPQSVSNATSLEDARKELDELIGLESVKKEINELTTYLKFLSLRQQKGFEEESKFNLNMVFTGNPGTGKTTVARMLGKIYRAMGLLSKDTVTEVGRVDLVAEFIGQTAPKTKAIIEQARGGILFIDEAYALTDRGDDGKDFGREVIEVLIKEMSDGKGDIAFVFAGYPKEMRKFLESNPGLSSRVGNIIHFPDYTPDELMAIADYHSRKRGVIIAPEARDFIYMKIVEEYRNRDEKFGNARLMNSVIDEGKQNMALRIMRHEQPETLSNDDLSTITLPDIQSIFGMLTGSGVEFPVDEALLNDALAQLRELVGLNEVKQEIDEIVKLVRYYKEIGKDLRKSFSLHTVFTGNPGTGKTTVARILIKIFKALGILEKGHLVETDRKGLVAGYVGQTAIQTDALIQNAMGGGLFIDEAYSLTEGGDGYGKEAVETLLKRMEDHRGEFVVIVAGYTEEMFRFLESNPGLKSRFDKFIHFSDYSPEDLYVIAVNMFASENLQLQDAAAAHLQQYIKQLCSTRNKYFGNARTMRKLVADTVHNQHLRMAGLPAEQRTDELIHTITLQDVDEFTMDEVTPQKTSIGFKMSGGSNEQQP
ncbi:MAG: AAA family ATPase [Chitinophagales bacterium]|nr:AAA family ATPase [Chitinophagales bacterium]HAE14504.1 stage V sporulation protein K [Bacteroidota bacterium]MCB9021370.1 AAA family ATPase [Chitinophagales bacterium]MCB9031675.1 AAA family ATPase [Chitinophagales bacterium]HAE34144.1 stage V sporulation protein K [Bacteroidota bacterium]